MRKNPHDPVAPAAFPSPEGATGPVAEGLKLPVVKKPRRLAFLEGIRGLAAMAVVLSHLMYMFYPVLNGDNATVMSHGFWVRILAASPLGVIHRGDLAVQIFFILSGIVLSLAFFRKPQLGILTSAALRRYFRLMLPALGSVIFAWLLFKIHAYHSVEAVQLMGRPPEVDPFAGGMSLFRAVVFGAFKVFFDPGAAFFINGPLWTMHAELQGSFLIFALLALIGFERYRYVIYGLLLLCLYMEGQILMIDFVLGVGLCDFFVELERKEYELTFPLWLGTGLLVLGLILGSFNKTWWMSLVGHGHAMVQVITAPPGFTVAMPGRMPALAAFLVIGAVMFCPTLQRAFEAKVFLFLGKISFSLYLFHCPIIDSLGCWTYVLSRTHQLSHFSSTLLASTVSVAFALLVAWGCYYALDLQSIKGARVFEAWVKAVPTFRGRLTGK